MTCSAMDKLVTCSVLTCLEDGALSCQLIFSGKTDAVLPRGAPPSVKLSRCETHRATTETILELLAWHQERVVSQNTPCFFWVFDEAPSHVSAETCARIKEELPSLIMCRESEGKTSWLQHLDIAVMGPLKTTLRTRCATEAATELFAKLVAESADVPVAEAVVDTRLPALRAKLPWWVGAALETLAGRLELHNRAWRHLSLTDGTRDELLADARRFACRR